MATKRSRHRALLTSLKVALVAATALALIWLVGWRMRSEWAADAEATMPASSGDTVRVLPTLAPLPTVRPTLDVRSSPALAPLPTPVANRTVPTVASLAPADSESRSAIAMPDLKPIPEVPAASPPRARTRGS